MIVLDKEAYKKLGYELYTLECDHCGTTFVFPDGHTHLVIPEPARAKAVLYGWSCAKGESAFYTGGKDYCEKCKEFANMGHLTDYAQQLIDKAEAKRKKIMDEWTRNLEKSKAATGGKSSGVLQPLIEIPLKTSPVRKENNVPDAAEKHEPQIRPEIPLEPIDEVIRFAASTVLIYPGMDKNEQKGN